MQNTNKSDFRSKLGKVRGLGSAKHGVTHWWFQRVTAVAMIPLFLWFISSILAVLISPDVFVIVRWFSQPINALLMVLLLVALFFHAKLGLQVVIEDYIKSPCAKYSLLIVNSLFCLAGVSFCIIAVLKLHFLNVAGI